jgi:hypothetical protein
VHSNTLQETACRKPDWCTHSPKVATPSSASQRELHTEVHTVAETASQHACLERRCSTYSLLQFQHVIAQPSSSGALVPHHCYCAAPTETTSASRRTKRPWHLLARKSAYPAATLLSNSSTQVGNAAAEHEFTLARSTGQLHTQQEASQQVHCTPHALTLCTSRLRATHMHCETTPLCPPQSLPI